VSTPNELRRVAVFAELGDQELAWLLEQGEVQLLEPGPVVVHEGDPASVMVAVLDGQLRAAREKGAPDGKVYHTRTGALSGMLPFSRLTHFPVTSRAARNARIFRFPAEMSPEMLERIPVLEGRLVTAMAERVREAAREDHQRETLLAPGKLSAGLAHELNNPAAAIRRPARSSSARRSSGPWAIGSSH
jgi:CRP-like cAMP-binding protein